MTQELLIFTQFFPTCTSHFQPSAHTRRCDRMLVFPSVAAVSVVFACPCGRWTPISAGHRLGQPRMVHSHGTSASRRTLLGNGMLASVFSAGSAASSSDAAALQFAADDGSFAFELPRYWVGVTTPEQERVSKGHLISVKAQRRDGSAYLQAIVDGGFRGRQYGTSLDDLGSLDDISSRLVQMELLDDDAAQSAYVVQKEKTGKSKGGAFYYVVYYQVGHCPSNMGLALVSCFQYRIQS